MTKAPPSSSTATCSQGDDGECTACVAGGPSAAGGAAVVAVGRATVVGGICGAATVDSGAGSAVVDGGGAGAAAADGGGGDAESRSALTAGGSDGGNSDGGRSTRDISGTAAAVACGTGVWAT